MRLDVLLKTFKMMNDPQAPNCSVKFAATAPLHPELIRL